MNPVSIVGSVIVTLALASYLIGILSEQRSHRITKKVITFLSVGLVFDISATICMIIGSTNSPFTIHGFIGYSALLVMIIENIRAWRFYINDGTEATVPRSLHLYSRFAITWWTIAYISGGLIAMVF